jgi:uncharacterized membrane protein
MHHRCRRLEHEAWTWDIIHIPGGRLWSNSGKLTDVGINDQFMKDVCKVAAALQGAGGTVLRSSCDETKEEVPQAALARAHDAVSHAPANA